MMYLLHSDIEPPEIICPANVSFPTDLGSNGNVVWWPQPVATDNAAVVSIISSQDNGTTFFLGTTAVTLTAYDEMGNTGQCQFTVAIIGIYIGYNDILRRMIAMHL